MYVLLFISLIILTLFTYILLDKYWGTKEEFVETSTEVESVGGERWQKPDLESLIQYTEARGITYQQYVDSFISDKHPDQLKRIKTQYDTYSKNAVWPSEIKSWSVVIVDGSVEFGYAFTMGHTMYLPISYLTSMDDNDLAELFFHELRHIWQRQDYGKFVRGLDREVWKGWEFRVVKDKKRAVQELKGFNNKNKGVVINPDTFQLMAKQTNSNHPIYPIYDTSGEKLVYVMRNHTQKYYWDDPHPCERDAREEAQKILNPV